MKPMPCRFLVLIDSPAGGDSMSDGPMRLGAGPEGADEWLATLQPTLEIPIAPAPGGAPRTVTLTCREPLAFQPTAIAARISMTGMADPPGIDSVLHNPSFQRLESTWRGLRFLLEHSSQETEVWTLAAERKSLAARFRQAIFEPWVSDPVAPFWSLILADFDFTHRAEEISTLRDLAGMAKVLSAPLVAATSPAFFDLRHLFHVTALPDIAGRLMDPAHAAWRTFQASEEARWAALTINRYLQREPYDLPSMGYKEASEEARPESYLWGRGIWMAGAAAARSVRTHGHFLDLSGRGGHFEGLPVRPFPVAANEMVSLSTEVPMPEEKAQEFSRAAFTPLVGRIRSNVAVLPIVVTLFRLNPGRLTVEATLAYQLTAGRFAQFCSLLLLDLPGDETAATDFLKSELTGFLGSLAGEEPEKAVTVATTRQEAEGKTLILANVKIRPAVPLEGKRVEFEFVLPLGQD